MTSYDDGQCAVCSFVSYYDVRCDVLPVVCLWTRIRLCIPLDICDGTAGRRRRCTAIVHRHRQSELVSQVSKMSHMSVHVSDLLPPSPPSLRPRIPNSEYQCPNAYDSRTYGDSYPITGGRWFSGDKRSDSALRPPCSSVIDVGDRGDRCLRCLGDVRDGERGEMVAVVTRCRPLPTRRRACGRAGIWGYGVRACGMGWCPLQ